MLYTHPDTGSPTERPGCFYAYSVEKEERAGLLFFLQSKNPITDGTILNLKEENISVGTSTEK